MSGAPHLSGLGAAYLWSLGAAHLSLVRCTSIMVPAPGT